jgi:hypothetical protein
MRYKEIKPLNEVEDSDLGVYNPQEDDLRKANMDDTRKPKLTLRMINRLKKIRATKKLEQSKKEGFLGVMYGAPKKEDDF